MIQYLANMRIEKWRKEKKYNTRILLFLFIGILIAFLFMAVLNARAKGIEKYRQIEIENLQYTKQIKSLLLEKKDLMKKLIASKEIELESLIEKAIYFKAVQLKNRSKGGIMKPAYLGLQRLK